MLATWENFEEIENVIKSDNVLSLKSDAIISQYSASTRLNALFDLYQRGMDANNEIDMMFYNLIDLSTATGSSLDIWGRIVGVSRTLKTSSGQIVWDDDGYRTLILYKALSNISSSDAKTIMSMLKSWFGENVYLVDNQDMTIHVVFDFYLSDTQSAILKYYGLLNIGSGVGWNFYQIDIDNTFGFDGSGLQPFNQGIFDPYEFQTLED